MAELKVGDGASFSHTIAECDIYNFAGLTGDLAPQHLDEAMMRRSAFGKRIAHGAMMVGFMSRVSTMAVAGVDSADGSETLVNQGYDRVRFVAPVHRRHDHGHLPFDRVGCRKAQSQGGSAYHERKWRDCSNRG